MPCCAAPCYAAPWCAAPCCAVLPQVVGRKRDLWQDWVRSTPLQDWAAFQWEPAQRQAWEAEQARLAWEAEQAQLLGGCRVYVCVCVYVCVAAVMMQTCQGDVC